MHRLILFEDQRHFRDGLTALFAHQPDLVLLESHGEASAFVERAEARSVLEERPPADLLLMDIEMPGTDGIEATRRLKAVWPGLPIVILTVFEEPKTILSAICAGADGYLLKTSSAPELLRQLRAMADGGAPMTSGVARSVLDLLRIHGQPSEAPGPTRLGLTEREQEVLRGLVAGGSYRQVADELGVSIDTVRSHIRGLYRKLQVHTVAQAVSRAIREGLV